MTMPKYLYDCDACEHSFHTYHGITENLKDCPQCEANNSLVRKVNKVFVIKKTETSSTKKVGELTKQFIEDNRDILKDYREDLQRKNYNDNENISD